ncbi:hypothetical protein T439DRAFT_323924, partial [Meredithblackwellia eburnea MCA 4105]
MPFVPAPSLDTPTPQTAPAPAPPTPQLESLSLSNNASSAPPPPSSSVPMASDLDWNDDREDEQLEPRLNSNNTKSLFSMNHPTPQPILSSPPLPPQASTQAAPPAVLSTTTNTNNSYNHQNNKPPAVVQVSSKTYSAKDLWGDDSDEDDGPPAPTLLTTVPPRAPTQPQGPPPPHTNPYGTASRGIPPQAQNVASLSKEDLWGSDDEEDTPAKKIAQGAGWSRPKADIERASTPGSSLRRHSTLSGTSAPPPVPPITSAPYHPPFQLASQPFLPPLKLDNSNRSGWQPWPPAGGPQLSSQQQFDGSSASTPTAASPPPLPPKENSPQNNGFIFDNHPKSNFTPPERKPAGSSREGSITGIEAGTISSSRSFSFKGIDLRDSQQQSPQQQQQPQFTPSSSTPTPPLASNTDTGSSTSSSSSFSFKPLDFRPGVPTLREEGPGGKAPLDLSVSLLPLANQQGPKPDDGKGIDPLLALERAKQMFQPRARPADHSPSVNSDKASSFEAGKPFFSNSSSQFAAEPEPLTPAPGPSEPILDPVAMGFQFTASPNNSYSSAFSRPSEPATSYSSENSRPSGLGSPGQSYSSNFSSPSPKPNQGASQNPSYSSQVSKVSSSGSGGGQTSYSSNFTSGGDSSYSSGFSTGPNGRITASPPPRPLSEERGRPVVAPVNFPAPAPNHSSATLGPEPITPTQQSQTGVPYGNSRPPPPPNQQQQHQPSVPPTQNSPPPQQQQQAMFSQNPQFGPGPVMGPGGNPGVPQHPAPPLPGMDTQTKYNPAADAAWHPAQRPSSHSMPDPVAPILAQAPHPGPGPQGAPSWQQQQQQQQKPQQLVLPSSPGAPPGMWHPPPSMHSMPDRPPLPPVMAPGSGGGQSKPTQTTQISSTSSQNFAQFPSPGHGAQPQQHQYQQIYQPHHQTTAPPLVHHSSAPGAANFDVDEQVSYGASHPPPMVHSQSYPPLTTQHHHHQQHQQQQQQPMYQPHPQPQAQHFQPQFQPQPQSHGQFQSHGGAAPHGQQAGLFAAGGAAAGAAGMASSSVPPLPRPGFMSNLLSQVTEDNANAVLKPLGKLAKVGFKTYRKNQAHQQLQQALGSAAGGGGGGGSFAASPSFDPSSLTGSNFFVNEDPSSGWDYIAQNTVANPDGDLTTTTTFFDQETVFDPNTGLMDTITVSETDTTTWDPDTGNIDSLTSQVDVTDVDSGGGGFFSSVVSSFFGDDD